MEEFDHDLIEYLKEFESSVRFDGEICPTCGLDFTKPDLKIAKWVQFSNNLPYSVLEEISEILDEDKIHYYFTRNDKAENEKVYCLLVLNDSLRRVEKLLSRFHQ